MSVEMQTSHSFLLRPLDVFPERRKEEEEEEEEEEEDGGRK